MPSVTLVLPMSITSRVGSGTPGVLRLLGRRRAGRVGLHDGDVAGDDLLQAEARALAVFLAGSASDYITGQVIESHGGKIWAESVNGESSTFYFTLRKKRP